MIRFFAALGMVVPISYLLFATFSDAVAVGFLMMFTLGLRVLIDD